MGIKLLLKSGVLFANVFVLQDTVVTYKCEYVEGERLYTDYTGAKGRPKLKLDENFAKTVN